MKAEHTTSPAKINQATSVATSVAATMGTASATANASADGFRYASLALCDLIGAHDFTLRERLVLELIRVQSFGAGRTEAYIPGLRYFARATRISCGNASTTLSGLMRKAVIQESPECFYGFVIPASQWRVPLRSESIEIIEQLLLLEQPPHLGSALRQTFVEQCQHMPPAMGGTSSCSAQAYGREPGRGSDMPLVPESGTREAFATFPNRERHKKTNKHGLNHALPESGTGAVLPRMQDLQPCNLALKQDCKDTRLQEYQDCAGTADVPESGRAMRGKLDGERQEVFDLLRATGALGPGQSSLPNWLDFVRRRPHVTRRLLGELNYRQLTEKIRNPGAWMMSQWRHWGRPDR